MFIPKAGEKEKKTASLLFYSLFKVGSLQLKNIDKNRIFRSLRHSSCERAYIHSSIFSVADVEIIGRIKKPGSLPKQLSHTVLETYEAF